MSAASNSGVRVCVTGGSGFIGSWLVHFLLEKEYFVHATVKNLEDENETKHLLAYSEQSRLRLFQMDLLDPYSITAAINGTIGLFHLASPVTLHSEDPEKELLDPAVKGTLNVLRAAKDCGINRVVHVSSTVAIGPTPSWPADMVIGEDCWADVDFLKKNELWYSLSKTLAEKAAWEFAASEGLNLAVINPGLVLGPSLQPIVGASVKIFQLLLQGQQVDMNDFYIGCVDVRNVAQAMIALYENPLANGRHLCEESIGRWIDFVNKVADLCPEFPVQRVQEDKQCWLLRANTPSKKLIDLGVRFNPIDKIIMDTLEDLKSKGCI